MKNSIYLLAVLLTVLAAGCTETTKVQPDPYVEPPYMEVSSNKLVFDADGGEAAIVIATNLEAWDYACEGDWYDVTRQDDRTLVVATQINGGPATLSGTITVSGSSADTQFTQTISIAQRAERSIDLSAEGTANCYIARTNRSYKFNATVKGNGRDNGDGNSGYIAAYGATISDIATVDLLWEARNDGDKSMSREIIDGSPTYSGGYIAFSTGRSQGNAVIAAKDQEGTILWSWHIWVCDDEITVHDHNNGKEVVAQIMDRNLGALNNTPMDINNRGMFYQWGRKDPFIPSRAPYVELTINDDLNAPENNLTNDEVGNGSGVWNFNGKALPIDVVPGNIPYSIQNPMTYLKPCYNDYYTWYCMSDDVAACDTGLWDAGQKTIFDPCPVGYKVPGNNLWGIPSGNDHIQTGGPVEDYGADGTAEQWSWTVLKECGRRWKYTGDYYPMVGNLYYSEFNGQITTHNYTSGEAFYWTGQRLSDPTDRENFRFTFNPNWAYYETGAPNFSAQIRCVKE